jgi:hypothetical protein
MDLLGPDVLTPPETLNPIRPDSSGFVFVTLHNFNIRDIAPIHAQGFSPVLNRHIDFYISVIITHMMSC